jgi:hypothetical protein
MDPEEGVEEGDNRIVDTAALAHAMEDEDSAEDRSTPWRNVSTRK